MPGVVFNAFLAATRYMRQLLCAFLQMAPTGPRSFAELNYISIVFNSSAVNCVVSSFLNC